MENIERVLLIDDDPTMRALLETLLSLEGFDVSCYIEKKDDDIVGFLKSVRPDAILLDVNLAFTNGIELLRTIKGDKELANTKILMTSGMDVKTLCLKTGADGFLLKPYMPDELIHWLRRHGK